MDVLDQTSCWRMARISEITGDQALVTFDGWSHKWDEVFLYQKYF